MELGALELGMQNRMFKIYIPRKYMNGSWGRQSTVVKISYSSEVQQTWVQNPGFANCYLGPVTGPSHTEPLFLHWLKGSQDPFSGNPDDQHRMLHIQVINKHWLSLKFLFVITVSRQIILAVWNVFSHHILSSIW